jgi:hypothetical protein
MKPFKRILISVLVLLVLLFSAAKILFEIKGKVLLAKKLEDTLGREVSIGYLEFKMPLALEIEDLEVKGLANVDYLYASPDLFGLLRGRIVLNRLKVLRPKINWVAGSFSEGSVKENSKDIDADKVMVQAREIFNTSSSEVKDYPDIIIKYLSIEDGTVNFTDQAVSQSGLRITLKELFVDVDNLCLLPKSEVTNFQLRAKIPWEENSGEGIVYASGWINLHKKDMQARLEIDGIDGIYLYPYYTKWVDFENSRIEQANLSFISDIQGQNNELVAKCRIELTDIKFRPRPPEEAEHKAEKIATMVLGMFRALNQGRVVLSFTVRTRMDKPEFDFGNINRAVEETISTAIKSEKVKIEDVAMLPAKFLEGMAKGTTGATKAIINGALAVGKSFLDALKVEEEAEEEVQQEELLKD